MKSSKLTLVKGNFFHSHFCFCTSPFFLGFLRRIKDLRKKNIFLQFSIADLGFFSLSFLILFSISLAANSII